MVRVLAIPLVPFVAFWELFRASVRALAAGLSWLGIGLVALLRLALRGLAALLRATGRCLSWIVRRLAAVVLPVLVRAGVIVRVLFDATAPGLVVSVLAATGIVYLIRRRRGGPPVRPWGSRR